MQISIEGVSEIDSKNIESASIEVQGRSKPLPDHAVIRLDHNWAYIGVGLFVEIIPREMVKLHFKMKAPEEKAPTSKPKKTSGETPIGTITTPKPYSEERKSEEKKKQDVKAFV